MSILRFNKVTEGNPPGAGQVDVFLDTSDNELKYIDEFGSTIGLSPVGWDDWNLCMNGGFEYAQLQTPGTLTTYSATADRVHTADNWKVTNENASVQYQQVDTDSAPEVGLNARYYGKFKKITNTGKMVISQVVSANDSAAARSENIRLQFSARYSGSTPSMSIRACVLVLGTSGTIDTIPATFVSAFGANGTDPTWGANISAVAPESIVNGSIIGIGGTFILSPNWQDFSLQFEPSANYKNLIFAVWSNSQLLANDELNIAQAQLCKGESVKDWAPFPSALELARINSILCKTFPITTAPVQNAGINTGEHKTKKIVAAATAGRFEPWVFPTVMRSQPTVTLFSPGAASAQVFDETGSVVCTAAAHTETDRQCSISFTGNVATLPESIMGVHIVADASI